MREFKPNDPLDPTHLTIDDSGRRRTPLARSDSNRLGPMIAVALAMMLGLLAWGIVDSRQRVADVTAAGSTQRATSTSPTPQPAAPSVPETTGSSAGR